MSDVQNAAGAPIVIHREDYQVPHWLIPEIDMNFALDSVHSRVTSQLQVRRSGDHHHPLRLDGDGLTPEKISVDGRTLKPDEWILDKGALILNLSGDAHNIEIEVHIAPELNTQLMGLYASGGMLCTQCEAEGFRRITFFPDRPDILSVYRVRMEADKARYPILLANGDPKGAGDLPGGRHWAEWHDPFPKPCYLFALVAGDLVANRDHFTTMSGRTVDLGIWVRKSDLAKTDHAMAALKAAMLWDEQIYGREYDLDVFNIVAVADFNFGAMENKGLNIFNSRYILADPDIATDMDYDGISGVVAHEYFHNWSGNRVTCRDWFQLSLKEGFTVFRDQCFSADQGSAAVKRIEDVRLLRAVQFPEDSGPLAHPIRPESYMEISNFYTATIYNKGAEVIRMMSIMLGAERFRRGSDLYFERHDGEAATCENFIKAVEDGGEIDLGQFRLWYQQAGTPKITASLHYENGAAKLALQQSMAATPGQPIKLPMVLPLKIRLFGQTSGKALGEEQLILFNSADMIVNMGPVAEQPVLSINRGFSTPAIVETDRSAADLAFLSAHDDDPFARYEAMQQLMLDTLVHNVATGKAEHDAVIAAVRNTLTDAALDHAFIAEAVLLPSESFIGDHMLIVDPEAIHRARESLRRDLGIALDNEWRAAYAACQANRFEYSPAAKGDRRLKTVALGYIAASGSVDAADLAYAQYNASDNMTDRQGALATLVSGVSDQKLAALDAFYTTYRDNALVIDKWFSTQALSPRDDAMDAVLALSKHPDFTLANPNRARALIGAFTVNQRGFHGDDGRGYKFLADMILALDKLNPQTAAKMVPPLGRWRRFDEGRAAMMQAELQRIIDAPDLSRDVFEQASKSLAG